MFYSTSLTRERGNIDTEATDNKLVVEAPGFSPEDLKSPSLTATKPECPYMNVSSIIGGILLYSRGSI